MLKIGHSVENYHTSHTEVKQTEPYIIFIVDNEEFGVEAQKVLELVKYMTPLKMPNNFVNVHGMTIFRGKIIPIVDFRTIFGLEPVAYDENAVTIVVESSISDFGITAERVLDLNFVPVASIKKVTTYKFGEKTKYLKSVANFDEHLILLLDLDKIIETKPSPTAFEGPVQSESFTKVETPSCFSEIKKDDQSQSISGKISGGTPALGIPLEDSKVSQATDSPPQLLENQIEPVREDTRITQPEGSEAECKKSSSYLIDPKELEDLLNGVTPKPEPGVKESINFENLQPQLPAETDQLSLKGTGSVAKNDQISTSSMDPTEIENILTKFEWGKKVTNESSDRIGANFDNQSDPTLSKEQVSLESINASDGILKPEQIEEVLSSLKSDLVVNFPEDLFQMKTATENTINSDQTGRGLSDEVIEGILRELDAESQMGLKETLSGNDNQSIKLARIEAPEEKSDE